MSYKHPANVIVKLRIGESQESILKRFAKKYKKENIAKEYVDKVAFFKTKTQKRRTKFLKNQWFRKNNRNNSKNL